jgi:hypothetical protein
LVDRALRGLGQESPESLQADSRTFLQTYVYPHRSANRTQVENVLKMPELRKVRKRLLGF